MKFRRIWGETRLIAIVVGFRMMCMHYKAMEVLGHHFFLLTVGGSNEFHPFYI